VKRFVWRLQHVLDVKAREEQAKRAELLEITEELAETRGGLLARQTVLRNIIAGITAEQHQSKLAKQEFFFRHSTTSDEEIKVLREKISELELKQGEKIGEVLKVRRFKEGLEKLRAEAKRKFIQEQEKLEQKELDEAAGNLFARKAVPILSGRGNENRRMKL
jgi:flagellar biosynthesis chaperone FliJ